MPGTGAVLLCAHTHGMGAVPTCVCALHYRSPAMCLRAATLRSAAHLNCVVCLCAVMSCTWWPVVGRPAWRLQACVKSCLVVVTAPTAARVAQGLFVCLGVCMCVCQQQPSGGSQLSTPEHVGVGRFAYMLEKACRAGRDGRAGPGRVCA